MDGNLRFEEATSNVEEEIGIDQHERDGATGIVPLLVNKMMNSNYIGPNSLQNTSVLVNGRMIQSRSMGALARLTNGIEKISSFETIGGPPKDECSTSGHDDGSNRWRAIERCVAASIKGFVIGGGLRGGLSLFAILASLRKRSSASRKSLKIEKTNNQVILAALRETLRYGLFLGTFAGGFCTVEETIAALGGSRRTARWRSLVAGAVVGPSLLLTGPKVRHTSMAIYILLRAAVLAARCGLKSERAGWLFKPLSWKHGDTFLMSLSSCQILSAWILKPSSLPKSYVSFLNKHGGKDVSIVKGINQLAFNTKPFTALKDIEDHYRSTGVDIKLDPEMTVCCTMVHGKQGCVPHFFTFWAQAYLRSLPVYVPVYLVPALLVHRQDLFARPSPILWKSVLGIFRSSLFLSVYTSSAWAWTCFLFRSAGTCTPTLIPTAVFPVGWSVMIEKKSRRMELALYCFARAIESFAICVADWGVLERYNLIPPKRIDVFLFSAATAIIMHCYDQERDVFRSKYLNVLDWVFGLPDGATKFENFLKMAILVKEMLQAQTWNAIVSYGEYCGFWLQLKVTEEFVGAEVHADTWGCDGSDIAEVLKIRQFEFVNQHLEVTNLGWDVATGIYHFLLMYALNKYGLYVWIRICSRSDHSIPWWKSLRGTNQAPSPVVEDEVLLRKLELLAEKGWLGTRDAAPALAPVMAMTEEEDDGDDEGCPLGMPISHSLSCSLVLAFQCVLSDEQIYQRADKMRKMFGSTPRVERFERSTVVQTSTWTHEGLLHDAAALVREACEEHPQCTLQVNSWGVFLWDIIGSSMGEVKLVKLRGLHVPVITSASQSPAVGMLEIRGLHLNEADLIAQTHDQSMRLLTKSKSSGDSEELEALSVACPPDVIYQDLHIYASKTVAVNDSLISVQCERVKVVSTNENFPASTDTTTWILAALIMAVPMTQIALSFLYPSAGSVLSILVGQGCGWMLGWLTRRLFTSRNASNRGKAPTPIEQDSSEKLELGSSWNRELFLLYLRQGCWLLLVVLLTVLSHWFWTHTGPVYKKWLFAGASIVTILVTLFKLHAKWRKTKEADIVSRRRYWTNLMSTAITYNDWTHAASMLHFESDVNEAKLYDEAYVQGKLRELQLRRKEGTTDEILFCLRADLIRHLGNMCNRDLHKHRSEVPVVISDYIKEVRTQLRAVCDMNVDEFSLEEKLTFLTETRQRFGRTALVFSGHVALGTFHSSVFRTLVEHQLVPSVIVGANLGAIVASFATTRTASELRHFFGDPSLPMDFYAKLSTVYVAAHRLRTQGTVSYEMEKLEQSMQELLGDLTFEEAFDLSGRILGISVPACPLGHQPAQFLNYLASPHVVIWSAVAVSCVPPNGLLHRPELMIKDRFDRIVPYVPPTKVTFEKAGSKRSLETEIPYRQVRELFNVNHFIVSQASPYMAPWLHFKESIQDRSSLVAKLLNLMEMEVRHRCAQLLDMGVTLRGLTSHCAQKWEGDINIILPITFSQATFTLHDDHSPNELRKVAMAGRRCTWAKISAIHASCGIELMLDEYINELHRRERHALHQEDNYQDVASPKSSRQSNETTTNQSSAPGVGTCTGDELPLEQSTPGYGTPSEVETEDYLLDHLCSCASSNPSSRRCAVAHTVSDQVHLVEECDTIDDSRGAELSSLVGDPAWPGESLHERGDFQTAEEQDEAPSSPAIGLESVCEQYRLQSEELQVECEISFEDHAESYDSPKTVLEGPSGRNSLHSRKVTDRISHPGCKLQSYFEEISNSSYNLDERDDDI